MYKKLCDTHTHIYFDQFKNNFDEVIQDVKNKLDFIVSIACDYESSIISFELAKKYPFIYASVGYHPVDISKFSYSDFNKMLEIAENNRDKIVAIGEIGLDYYWMKDDKKTQEKYFTIQLEAAKKLDMPVIIHTRDSIEDTINILKGTENYGILHAFSGTYEDCLPVLDRFYIGVGGTLTFKNNHITKELVKKLPLEKIVIETDCPFLTPVPHRGKTNFPVYVEYVAKEIANIKGIDLETVINQTTENAYKIFKIGT